MGNFINLLQPPDIYELATSPQFYMTEVKD